jgi:hypothetical protein
MADFSLVPVDHQPEFDNFSLVPVDHDPFGAEGVVQQSQAQPLQAQQAQIPTPATGVTQPDVGTLTNYALAADSGESWHPESDPPTASLAAPIPSPDNASSQPFGELKPVTYAPTQQMGNLAADALMGLGMKPYFANDLTSRIGNILGLTPLGVAGSALDLIDAKRRDDLPGVLAAAAGMIPGAKGVAEEAIHLHHAWPKYLGGPVKQDLVPLPKSLHQEFHKGLDVCLPRRKATAYYESLGPKERQGVLQHLATYTKDFDAEHGTKLYDALLKNGFSEP